MATSPTLGTAEVAQPIPPSTEHAISSSFPTWHTVVEYMAEKIEIMQLFENGYPRFFPHPLVYGVSLAAGISLDLTGFLLSAWRGLQEKIRDGRGDVYDIPL